MESRAYVQAYQQGPGVDLVGYGPRAQRSGAHDGRADARHDGSGAERGALHSECAT